MGIKYADVLRGQVAELEAERAALVVELDAIADGTRSATDDRVREIGERGEQIKADIAEKNAEADKLDKLEAERDAAPKYAGPQHMRRRDPFTDRPSTDHELRTAQAVSAVEQMAFADDELRSHIVDTLESSKLERNGDLAGWAIATSSPDYATAFVKLMRDSQRGHLEWSAAEQAAVVAVRDFTRSTIANSGTGGYLSVPLALDPAIQIVNNGALNPLGRILANQAVIVGTDTWRKVFSEGITATFDAELSEVADGSPSFGIDDIKAEKWHAFASASYEAADDVADMWAKLSALFTDAADRLEADKLMTGLGTGSNEPFGLVTRLVATTNSRVDVTTNGQMGWVDVIKLDNALPARFRPNASFLAPRAVQNEIRAFGAGASPAAANYWADTRDGLPPQLLGEPIYEVTEGLNVVAGSGVDLPIVLGDLRACYTVVRRAPTTVVDVPALFSGTNNMPNGSRGWYVYGRTGGDVVAPNAARLLRST